MSHVHFMRALDSYPHEAWECDCGHRITTNAALARIAHLRYKQVSLGRAILNYRFASGEGPVVSLDQHRRNVAELNRTRTCPHCLQEYQLGINGVQNGCDTCEGIVRLPNGQIDMTAYTETFIVPATGEEIPA